MRKLVATAMAILAMATYVSTYLPPSRPPARPPARPPMASCEPFPRVCFLVCSDQEEAAVRALERAAAAEPTSSVFFADIVRVADAQTDFDRQVFQRIWSWRTSVLVTTSTSNDNENDNDNDNEKAATTWRDNPLADRLVAQLPARLRKKWIHLTLHPRGPRRRGEYEDQEDVFFSVFPEPAAGPGCAAVRAIYACYLNFAADRSLSRPRASVFTTAYHSGSRIFRVYDSLCAQTEKDWEWVVLDDSKTDDNFAGVLRDISRRDARVRVFRRDFPSGCIGRAKSEAAALCEGEVLVEVDHDDRLMPDALEQLCGAFDAFPDAGFAYMNYAEVHEEGETPFRYPEPFALGYGYYREVPRPGGAGSGLPAYQMANTPDINDLSVTNIVGVPNHPRAWRREVLLHALGNFSPMLPVADDYELLLHTVARTPAVKIDRLGYVQFRNSGGNNFTFLKNQEITRLQSHLSRLLRARYDMDARFRAAGVHERDGIQGKRINYVAPANQDELFVAWEKVFG